MRSLSHRELGIIQLTFIPGVLEGASWNQYHAQNWDDDSNPPLISLWEHPKGVPFKEITHQNSSNFCVALSTLSSALTCVAYCIATRNHIQRKDGDNTAGMILL